MSEVPLQARREGEDALTKLANADRLLAKAKAERAVFLGTARVETAPPDPSSAREAHNLVAETRDTYRVLARILLLHAHQNDDAAHGSPSLSLSLA